MGCSMTRRHPSRTMQIGANDTVSLAKSMKTASRFDGWLSTNGGMTPQRKTIAPRGLFNFSKSTSNGLSSALGNWRRHSAFAGILKRFSLSQLVFTTKASVRDDGSEPSTLQRMEKSMPKHKGRSIKAYLTVTDTSSDRCFVSERISSYVSSQRNSATWCFI